MTSIFTVLFCSVILREKEAQLVFFKKGVRSAYKNNAFEQIYTTIVMLNLIWHPGIQQGIFKKNILNNLGTDFVGFWYFKKKE